MANTNAPMGARVVSNLEGSPWNGRGREYTVLANDSTPLYIGDLVKIGSTTGAVNQFGDVLPVCTASAATNTSCGIVIGFKTNPNSLSTVYRPASTLATAIVCDDPTVLFEMQANGIVVATAITLLGDIVYAAGSAYFNTSASQLDYTTVGSSGTTIQIMGISQTVNNELGLYCKVICRFKKHAYI
jgi:hypothetical protein